MTYDEWIVLVQVCLWVIIVTYIWIKFLTR